MTFVEIGLEEGIRRGKLMTYRDIAFHMAQCGVSFEETCRLLGISRMNLRYLLNCTDWDICSTQTNMCRINEPVYKTL